MRAFHAIHPTHVRAKTLVEPDVRAFIKKVEIVIAEQGHLRVPRRFRPSFGFAPHWAPCGAASLAALWWLLEHFAEQSPPRDLRHSQARYWPYSSKETATFHCNSGP